MTALVAIVVVLAPLVVVASQSREPFLPQLVRLAAHITAVPADHRLGPYTYVRAQSWTLQPDDTIGRVEVEHWQHVDGSVHMVTRRLPSWNEEHDPPDGSDRPAFAAVRPQVRDFTIAQVGAPVTPESISTDPVTLIAQLRSLRGGPPDTDDLLFAITEINYRGYLGRDQRAAVLRVIADLAGVTYEGQTTDLAGRRGVTVRYSGVSATTWLTLNPVTGEVLAYRRVFHTPPTFASYWLLLDRDRRDRR